MAESSGYSATYRDEQALTKHFIAVLEQRLAGRDAERRTHAHPLDWCHLGVLGPAKQERTPVQVEATALEAELDETPAVDANSATAQDRGGRPAKVASTTEAEQPKTAEEDSRVVPDKGNDAEGTRRPPSALGFEILVEPDEKGFVEFIVQAKCCLFTKHLPTLKEQTSVLDTGASENAPLAEVTRRWPIHVDGIRFRVSSNERESQSDDGRLQQKIDSTLKGAFSRPDVEKLWKGPRPKVDRPEYLKDEIAFKAFLGSITAGLASDTWSLRASVELRTVSRPDGKIRLGCYLRNETPETPATVKGRGLRDAFLTIGDAELQATLVAGRLHPIEILPVPQDYQYDRRVWAVGHNSSVIANHKSGFVATRALAVYEQVRILTRDTPKASFTQLANDPFVTLGAIHQAMANYAQDWKDRVIGNNVLELDTAALAECTKDYDGFIDEIDRFAAGIAALNADQRLLVAFKAANRVFGKLARGYESWHLFQIVFIVTQLPALAAREGIMSGQYPAGQQRQWTDVLDWGDVLWFRTGGGKTEAYLGLSCCAIIYDRLRGKTFGITAWLRFPLRMLSVQQLQRAMRVIWETERERKELLGEKHVESDPVRLGYFVGSTTTPNALSEEALRKYTSDDSLEWLRVVPDCPACDGRGTVKVSTDMTALRFRHTCTQCRAELPLDVSDDEIYRHLPTLVVGTIDKMASVGQQPKFGMLWGGAHWRCAVHGYAFGEYCSAFGCKQDKKTRRKVKPYDPSPSLHIQDELHLLQEELGAFAGHYETLIRYCERELSGRPSKVVAATATIEGFERQVRHLYGVKNARRFPGRGYDRLRTFYAQPDIDEQLGPKTARFVVAFKSVSMTPADASAYCTQIVHEEIGRLFSEPHTALAFLKDAQSPEDVFALLSYYSTTLNYVSSLARGSRVSEALQSEAAHIRRNAPRELNVEYHSSRSTSAEVTDLVHRVESPPKWEDAAFLDALVATNMISHGVDLERVNLMTMDGVPEQTAEYIQASSRTGRRHIGVVVVVLAGFSLRATSIYHRFIEYHQHLDRMVSPVPVNRFAKYAAQRTLPGVALGLVYGKHGAQSGRSGLNKRNEVVQLLAQLGDGFFDETCQAYFLGEDVYDASLEQALTQTLREQLEVVRMSIRNSHEPNVRDAIRPSPMRSLRDVEAGVPFWADTDSRVLTFIQKTRE